MHCFKNSIEKISGYVINHKSRFKGECDSELISDFSNLYWQKKVNLVRNFSFSHSGFLMLLQLSICCTTLIHNIASVLADVVTETAR